MKTMKRRHFNKLAKQYDLSKEATRRAWVMVKYQKGTDDYGGTDAKRREFVAHVNSVPFFYFRR